MIDKKGFELSDNELDKVSGGVSYSVSQRNVGDPFSISKCACCGGTPASGKITAIHPEGRVVRLDVMMNCCGGMGTYSLVSEIRDLRDLNLN